MFLPDAVAVNPPQMISAVWDDANNGDVFLSTGDTLTVQFDVATNQPGGSGFLSKDIVDNLFSFENSIGANYTGIWTSPSEFTISIGNATGATASVGDIVAAKGTLQFVGELDITGGTPFSAPYGVATNSTDYIFVSDTDNDKVQIFNPNGTFAGELDTTGGTPFSAPLIIATNSSDFIFVSDNLNDNIQIFNPNGTFAGELDTTGGTPFFSTLGMAINSTDFIFVGEAADTNIVQIFNPGGTFAGELDVSEIVSFTPLGIATNSTDFIFVGSGSRLHIFNPDGVYAETKNVFGFPFNVNMRGVVTNSTDHIFVSDTQNDVVHMATPDGTFFGTVDQDGVPTSSPRTVAVNSRDDLIVVASDVDMVQVFSQGIRDSTSQSLSSINEVITTGDFGNPPCSVPSTGNWTLTSDCILLENGVASGNVILQNNSALIIPDGITLDMDFENFYLLIESGSGVLIESGGTIN